MTITYDDQGLCTRCGSTGWLPVAQRHPGDHPQTHATIFSVKPCPCHGWRPIETAPEYVQVYVGARYPSGTPTQWQTAKAWLEGERSRWMLSDKSPASVRCHFRPTHWQPLHQPPEEA